MLYNHDGARKRWKRSNGYARIYENNTPCRSKSYFVVVILGFNQHTIYVRDSIMTENSTIANIAL